MTDTNRERIVERAFNDAILHRALKCVDHGMPYHEAMEAAALALSEANEGLMRALNQAMNMQPFPVVIIRNA